MTREQEILLELIKYEFWHIASWESMLDADWNTVLLEAKYHKLIPFFCDSIGIAIKEGRGEEFRVSSDIMNYLHSYSISVICGNHKRIKLQRDILNVINDTGIKACVMKGTTLAVNYPKPELRELGDLDIYVAPELHEAIENVLTENGFELYDTLTQYHSLFLYQDFELELHNSLAGLPSGKTRSKMLFLKDMCERAHVGDYQYANNLEPDVVDNAIIQLLHMLHHTKEKGMTLRLLIDWMMFVDKHVKDDTWSTKFEQLLKELGLDKMAKIVTKICKKYLGFSNSEVTWCDEISDEMVTPFFEYIMAHGKGCCIDGKVSSADNQLRKDEWEYRSASMGAYLPKVFFRSIVAIVSGRKKLSDVVYFWKVRKKNRRFLLELNLLDKEFVGDYSF